MVLGRRRKNVMRRSLVFWAHSCHGDLFSDRQVLHSSTMASGGLALSVDDVCGDGLYGSLQNPLHGRCNFRLLAVGWNFFVSDDSYVLIASFDCFRIYHSFCEIETYMERKKSILSNIWLVKAVEGLEKNVVPGR